MTEKCNMCGNLMNIPKGHASLCYDCCENNKEFNLSDKTGCEDTSDEFVHWDENNDLFNKYLKVEDVREAVRLLKQEILNFSIHNTGVHRGFLIQKINEIFGSKLI